VLNALLLAAFTAGRFFFVSRLGERVVADIRQALFGHVLTLDTRTITGCGRAR
jgi:ATP-binding cassette subfamily B protein